jgi:hypothetical protein
LVKRPREQRAPPNPQLDREGAAPGGQGSGDGAERNIELPPGERGTSVIPESSQQAEPRWKGFRLSTLRQFGITVQGGEVDVPYLTRAGEHYRTKRFHADGSQRWVGESKPLIPYGAETLRDRTREVFLTEGESDALALRIAFPASAVLGIPGASAWKSEWAALVEPFDAVYLSFDSDKAGRRLFDAVKADVPNYRPVLLPEGADTRDVLQILGRRDFNILLAVADRSHEQRVAWANLDAAVHERQRVEQAWRAAA